MAAPTYATDLTIVDDCEDTTGWSELSGHTSGGAPAQDGEAFLENTYCVSQSTGQATGTNAGLEFDYGSNITMSAGDVFIFWQMFAAPNNIDTWANGGMRVGVGSASGAMKFWNALGKDFGAYPYGGWQNTAIDPTFTADATDGSPGSTYRYFGSLPNMLNKVTKGNPHCVDAIRYGRGQLSVINGETADYGTFAGMATANDASTARWGLFQARGGSYIWKGLMSLGTTTAVDFRDSNVNIQIEDTPRTYDGFNKIEINHASSNIEWTSVTICAVATSITGSAPISKGDFTCVDNATVELTNCVFTNMGTFTFQSNSTLDGCTFRKCEEATQGGAQFTSCIFEDCPDTVSLVVSDLDLIDYCHFVSDGSNHAVNAGTISADTEKTWNSTSSGYSATDGNQEILCNVGVGYTLTINVAAGATTPNYKNTGSGTVSIVVNPVTLLVKVQDIDTKANIENARVIVKAGATGPLSEGTVIINGLTNSSGEISDQDSYASDQSIVGWARKSTSTPLYKESSISGTINKDTGLTVNLLMIRDD